MSGSGEKRESEPDGGVGEKAGGESGCGACGLSSVPYDAESSGKRFGLLT